MSLEMYFKDDIERTIAGLVTMAIESCRAPACEIEYLSGVLSMARSVALVCGCDWKLVVSEVRNQGYDQLLDGANARRLSEKISP